MAGSVPVVDPIMRKGITLIIPVPAPRQAAILPPLCVRCGRPADGKPVEKIFYWHHPALFLLILPGLLIYPIAALLPGLLIYAIVAMIAQKSIRVRVPLCAHHAQRHSTAVILAWVLPLIGVVDAFVLPQFSVDGVMVALITVVLLFAGLVIWAVVCNPIRPKSVNQYCGVFFGFCQIFLEQFPQVAAARPQMMTPPPPI